LRPEQLAPAERLSLAERVAAEVPDPELPMLTLADLGVLRAVRLEPAPAHVPTPAPNPHTGTGTGTGTTTNPSPHTGLDTAPDPNPQTGPRPGQVPEGTAGPDGGVVVVAELTPTYSGCPAMAEMRADVAARLQAAGFPRVRVRTVLDPPWTTDLITAEGRRKLAAYGIAPPGPAPARAPGPVPLVLGPVRHAVPCPRCGSPDTEETSRFSATACKSLWRCRACREPFEHVKEV
jgi:ring-1,2-phenylacetyl-CoA epoxidase subunit PaaD